LLADAVQSKHCLLLLALDCYTRNLRLTRCARDGLGIVAIVLLIATERFDRLPKS
jgi:hypothetical protein